MSKSVDDLRERLATIERYFRFRNGPDLSLLNDMQIIAYRRHVEQYHHGLSAMSEDEAAAALYARMASNDLIDLDEDIARLLDIYVEPLSGDTSDEAALLAYQRAMEDI